MAEVAQYQFSFKELTELLVKQNGIHEGTWILGFNLNIGTGLMGPTPDQSYPSAMVQITSAILTRAEPGQHVSPSAVDAAVVNPRSEQPSLNASSGEAPKARRGRQKPA